MTAAPSLMVKVYPRIALIGQAPWAACAGHDNPFLSYEFLSSLEESGSVGEGTGWLARHVALLRGDEVVAVAPCYAKTHSYGEYVFDHAWANALTRAGGHYYPKLQVAVPFTPVPGARLLCRPGVEYGEVLSALEAVCAELRTSSVHITFCTEGEALAAREAGWLTRLGVQFHWENRGYASFDEFLAALSSRKRKAVRKERQAARAGLRFEARSGAALTPEIWRHFYRFYLSTVERKWGGAYLTPEFFPLLGEKLGERVVLMLAWRDGRPIAGALNLRSRDTLHGRNWGADEDVPFLHFELCYYQAIEYAIAHGLARVEAGAQGEHKISRGYLPARTHSAHYIRHEGLRRAVGAYLEAERAQLEQEMKLLAADAPYRQEA
ncbi:GNAT family N-acetyltransferase [Acidocella sp.]|uniref:GNAT family N-acetyltransferase n=1 Tax=Acidocella sp. TaxID=50710 RepID=UPI0026101542|nr:GNAT family N-acetyltransferase [Acidocella sp.]